MFQIKEVYPGSKYEDVAISELLLDGVGVHCFAPNTPITLPNGSTTPISQLSEGDSVLSVDVLTGKTFAAAITGMATANHHNVVELTFADRTLVLTDDHPLCDENGHWKAVTPQPYAFQQLTHIDQLSVGDRLRISGPLETEVRQLLAIKHLDVCQPMITITTLSRGQTFIANGLVVPVEILPASQP